MAEAFRYLATKPLQIGDEHGHRVYETGEELPGAEGWGYQLNALINQGSVVRVPVLTDAEVLELARERGLLESTRKAKSTPTQADAGKAAADGGSETEPQPDGFPVHRGGGFYELSDGSSVRGKAKAEQAQAKLDKK